MLVPKKLESRTLYTYNVQVDCECCICQSVIKQKKYKNVSTPRFHVKPDLCKLANKCQITMSKLMMTCESSFFSYCCEFLTCLDVLNYSILLKLNINLL